MEAICRSTTAILSRVLADRPAMLAELEAANTEAFEAVDAELLELCRLRVAGLLGADFDPPASTLAAATLADLATWHDSAAYTAVQRACLAFTDQFVVDVASLDDATAAAVAGHLGDEGLVDFANALLVVEQRQRMCLAWSRLIPEVVG